MEWEVIETSLNFLEVLVLSVVLFENDFLRWDSDTGESGRTDIELCDDEERSSFEGEIYLGRRLNIGSETDIFCLGLRRTCIV